MTTVNQAQRPTLAELRENLASAVAREMDHPCGETKRASTEAAHALFGRWAELRDQSERARHTLPEWREAEE